MANSRRKYAAVTGIRNTVTIATKQRVDMVMKVIINPTKRVATATKRLIT